MLLYTILCLLQDKKDIYKYKYILIGLRNESRDGNIDQNHFFESVDGNRVIRLRIGQVIL
jgi:hypothetical protein